MAPLKLAIIGGGPSSFYVASRLLSLFPEDEPLSSQLKYTFMIDYGCLTVSFAMASPQTILKSRHVFPLPPLRLFQSRSLHP